MTVMPPERAVIMNGERRELQPRVMQVLITLAHARPAVVSRDKLVELCWGGRIVGDDAVNRCVLALRHLADEFSPPPFTIETVPRVGHRLVERGGRTAIASGRGRSIRRQAFGITAVVALLALLALFASRPVRWPWQASPRAPTVLVTAAANDGESRQLARDLTAQLASLQTVHPASIRLLDDTAGSADKPDFTLQVSRRADHATIGATAVLTVASSRAILWSKDFEQPSRNLADLRQQIAFTAAHVLRCASEGRGSDDPLGHETLKTYLNACAAMSDAPAYDGRSIVRALESVVGSSPGFVGGWAKLLQAETEALISPVVPAGPTAAASLRRHILAARRLEPDLPEAYLAEFYLTRPIDFVRRARLLDEVVDRNPSHAATRSIRALFFSSTGAMGDAVREAREAVRLDPLSPALRDSLVGTLAAAGQTNAALAEVAEIERLWPGASSTIEARYRVGLRYGDPREALRLIHSGAVDSPVAPIQRTFLEARIDPSAKNVERAIRQAQSLYRDHPEAIYNYAQTLAEFDRKEELLEVLLHPRDLNELALSAEAVFRPAFREVHRDPRFIRVANSIGLLRYWRQSGHWPDFCYAPDLPYDCKAEAAKVGG